MDKTQFRWKKLHDILMKKLANYDTRERTLRASEINARWNESKQNWDLPPHFNCITSIHFFLGYMLCEGTRYPSGVPSNLVKGAAEGKGIFSFAPLEPVFSPAASNSYTVMIKALANDNANYSKTDWWPWWKMPFGLTGSLNCKCGMHVSPAKVLSNKNLLSKVNVISMSVASGERRNWLSEKWASLWDYNHPYETDSVKRTWEYTDALLFKLGGKLYVYHHENARDINGRTISGKKWYTFEEFCKVYINFGKSKDKEQDTLYLIWRIPDHKITEKNPYFFLDDDLKKEWDPRQYLP